MTISTGFIASAILLMISVFTGIILGLKGRPLSTGWFNAHKFISLGSVILLIILIQGLFSHINSSNFEIYLFFIALASLILLFITGGLLAALKNNLPVFRVLHILGTLTFIGSGAPLILFLFQKISS